MVEVDGELGSVEITGYLVVEDCGRMLNPAVVDGQIRGGIAQGIGLALHERVGCDEAGNPVAANLMDYLLPTAVDVPRVALEHMESEPIDELDFRAAGEERWERRRRSSSRLPMPSVAHRRALDAAADAATGARHA